MPWPSPAAEKYYESKLEYDLDHALTHAKRAGWIDNPVRGEWLLVGHPDAAQNGERWLGSP